MEKRTLKIQLIKVSLWFDWIIIPIIILIGIFGIRASGRLGPWTQLFERTAQFSKIASLANTEGLVRYQKAGFIAWQENLKSTTFTSGDKLVTSEEGMAEIILDDHSEIRVTPSTQIVTHTGVHNPSVNSGKKRSWIKKLLRPLPTFPYLEIEFGRVDVLFTKSGNPVPIMAEGKLYHLEKFQSLALKNHQVSIETLTRQSLNFSHLSRKEHEVTPTVPQVLAPLTGARFISTSTEQIEVPLRWKPISPDLKAEIEMSRVDDPDFVTTSQVSRNGALAGLHDGQYRWKVRTVSSSGKKSDWSTTHLFSIQEYVRGSKSIIPIQSSE